MALSVKHQRRADCGLRFNKPDWDRNYSWLPEPKRLINGIFMKGASKMNI